MLLRALSNLPMTVTLPKSVTFVELPVLTPFAQARGVAAPRVAA